MSEVYDWYIAEIAISDEDLNWDRALYPRSQKLTSNDLRWDEALYGPTSNDIRWDEALYPNKTVKANPIVKDTAMRKGIMLGARRIAPRFVPYVGWGLLAKDIYDYFKD